MDHTKRAIGYFKVFTTEGRHVRDAEVLPSANAVGLPYRPEMDVVARRNIAQWVFFFHDDESRAKARTRALAKAEVVLGRLDGRGKIRERVTQVVPNVHAIRVG